MVPVSASERTLESDRPDWAHRPRPYESLSLAGASVESGTRCQDSERVREGAVRARSVAECEVGLGEGDSTPTKSAIASSSVNNGPAHFSAFHTSTLSSSSPSSMGKKSNQARFPVVSPSQRALLKRELISHPRPPSRLTSTLTDSQARIKKLIQADEDVGKVAQGTPIVVCEFAVSHFSSLHALSSVLS